jgi:hypothetical protein
VWSGLGVRRGVIEHQLLEVEGIVEASVSCSAWLALSPRNPILLITKMSGDAPWKCIRNNDESLDPPQQGRGEEWAAKKNRREAVRTHIVEALQSIESDRAKWPEYIRIWFSQAATRPRFSNKVLLRPFQAPPFDRLSTSIDEWRQRANRAWEQHLNEFIEAQRRNEELGFDEIIPQPKRTRGRGKGKQRKNADAVLRYEWAARKLIGESYNDIAVLDIARDSPSNLDEKRIKSRASTVQKAVEQILRVADWQQS